MQRICPGADNHAMGKPLLAVRDLDGNLINFFTPVSAEAIKKFNS